MPTTLTRRGLLATTIAVPVVGCAPAVAPPVVPDELATPEPTPTPGPPTSGPSTPRPTDDLDFAELERRFDARLGVYAIDPARGIEIAHRADERFAFCSSFKGLATAAVLDRLPPDGLQAVVGYGSEDLMESSVVTRDRVRTGMTVLELCDAAVRFSDGTAGNLLLERIGGPAGLTDWLRGIGDRVTRMDRIEPFIVSAVPGDDRDTSTPRALGTSYRTILLGSVLPQQKRAVLSDLMHRTTTGGRRIKAAVPAGWSVANKTGTGDHATMIDVAVVGEPGASPRLLSIMSSRADAEDVRDEAIIAEAARRVIAALR